MTHFISNMNRNQSVIAVIVGLKRLQYCMKAEVTHFVQVWSLRNVKVLLRTLARGGGIASIVHARN
jgi:hypothetical protein